MSFVVYFLVFWLRIWEEFLCVRGWSSGFRCVDRFLRHYRRRVGSERTRVNVLKALYQLCRFTGLGAEELVRLSPREASEKLQAFLDAKHGEGRSIRYLNTLKAYLETFFKVNGFRDRHSLEVERYHQPARYRKKPEYIPTPEEIWRMAYAAGSKRNRALILFAYESGLRNATIRALRYGDVAEELGEGLEIVRVPVYPEMKNIDPGACKGGIPYYTFIGREAVQALKEYLSERIQKYGSIVLEDPLFCSDTSNIPPEVRKHMKLAHDTLDDVVRRAAKRAGIKEWKHIHPHCLRKAFDTALRNSGIDVDDREFLMGHVLPGSREAYYDRTKVEDLRVKYARVVFFPEQVRGEELRKKQIVDMMRILRFPEDRIKHVEEILAKHRSVDEAMSEIRRLSLQPPTPNKSANDPKKIISEEELEHYLAEGWDVQTVLPSGKILVKKAV
jgi:integrase/recombinase XerD